jgi:hypothetical protein
MSYGPSFHDNQPIWYFKRMPVYATTVLTAGFVVGLILCVILESAGLLGVLVGLAFTTPTFLHGALWQPLTYVWLGQVSFFTPLGILCFYCWAVEVEKYIGRSRFFKLFGTLVLTPVVLGVIFHAVGIPSGVSGNYALVASLLIAFATLYPNIEYFGWIPLKWFAFACLAIGSLMYFPRHDWMSLMQLWASCGVAFGFIRWLQLGAELPRIRLPSFRRRPKLRVLPTPIPRAEQFDEEEDASMSEVDVLLDKIAKSGIGSLTAKERERLEKAREELMKRETPRR